MALKLELAQTVAVGPFNPYIITAEWLARYNIPPERDGGADDLSDVRFELAGEVPAFHFRQVKWEVDLRRLVVTSLKKDCGAIVCEVLRQLNHTPVRAIGHNFHYLGSLEEWAGGPLPSLGNKGRQELAPIAQFEQVRWAGMFHREGARVEVMFLVANDEQLAVMFNHHRETDPRDFNQAVTAATQFQNDRDYSEQLVRSLFSQEIRK